MSGLARRSFLRAILGSAVAAPAIARLISEGKGAAQVKPTQLRNIICLKQSRLTVDPKTWSWFEVSRRPHWDNKVIGYAKIVWETESVDPWTYRIGDIFMLDGVRLGECIAVTYTCDIHRCVSHIEARLDPEFPPGKLWRLG